ncbi:MAG: hypothetical protein Q8O92_13355 [Candidatus Latescibacter sp.]|nr:hypothetical protein [Candidatus Latescibacter sp.]
MKPFCTTFVLLLCFSLPAAADEWHVYSNVNDINALAREGDTLWWTTRTGIVEWNRVDGTYHVY